MKPSYLFIFFALLYLTTSKEADCQNGIPFISYFSEIPGNEVQNWSVCQDKRNIMYFANRRGLMTYDGMQWEIHSLPDIPLVLQESAADGRIYIGAQYSYGYLVTGSEGKPEYIRLSENDTATCPVTAIYFADSAVIFYSERRISKHYLNGEKERISWEPGENDLFNGMIILNGSYFFNLRNLGLCTFRNGDFVQLPEKSPVSGKEILFSLPAGAGKVLVGTDDNRMYLFNGREFKEFSLKNQDFFRQNILSDARIISNTLIAVSSLYGGVMILDSRNGELKTMLDYQNGLPDDEIYAMATDHSGGLWLTHAYGICRADFILPVTDYSHYPGLNGQVTSIHRAKARLYAGTSDGIYFLDEVKEYDNIEILYRQPPEPSDNRPLNEKDEDGDKTRGKPVRKLFSKIFSDRKDNLKETEPEKEVAGPEENQYKKKKVSRLKAVHYMYRKVVGVENKCRQIIGTDNGILVLTSSGLYSVNGERGSLLSGKRDINSIGRSADEMYFAACSDGIYPLFNENGKWIFGEKMKGYDLYAGSVLHIERNQYWLGSEGSVYRMMIDPAGESGVLSSYTFSTPFPVLFYPEMVNDSLYIFSETGIRYYNESTDSFINYIPAGKGGDGKNFKFILSSPGLPLYNNGEIWRFPGHFSGRLGHIEKVLGILDEPVYLEWGIDSAVWVVEKNGAIFRISDKQKVQADSVFSLFIPKVSAGEKDYFDMKNLEFSSNVKGITIRMRAPQYLKESSVSYQYYVEGLMDGWSEWTRVPEINLFLESGRYRVHLRAMDIMGNTSSEKILNILIKKSFTRTIFFWILVSLGLLVVFILILRARELKLKHDKKILEEKVQLRTIELQKKKEQIEFQRDEIMKQKQEITSSIEYASRIQSAMFSEKEIFGKEFNDYFVFFKPKDIVSGDFYWIERSGDRIFFAAADCTGHGVPGALMSMLGISILNEIATEANQELTAAGLLEMLRKKILMSISSQHSDHHASDGLDIAFCIYDQKKQILQYAGAFNPLYHFRNEILTEYKADRMPIGYYLVSKKFSNVEIQIEKGDIIYIFSDGFADQFGGPENKKYSSQRFRSGLKEIVHLPMKKQGEELERRFSIWKGNNPQLDDIIILGIKF